MERDCESELSKLNIEQNACIYHFGASVIHGQRSNILRLRFYDCSVKSIINNDGVLENEVLEGEGNTISYDVWLTARANLDRKSVV